MIKNIFIFIFLCFSVAVGGQNTSKEKNISKNIGKEIHSILDKAYSLHVQKKFKESFQLNIKALQLALENENDKYTSEAYGALGIGYRNQGDTIEVRKNFELSHKYALKSNDLKCLANSYNNLASLYYTDEKKAYLSFKYANKAIEIYKEMNDTLGLQYLYNNQAIFLEQQKRYDEMLVYLDLLRSDMFKETNYLKCNNDLLRSSYYTSRFDYKKADSLILGVIKLCKKVNIPVRLQDGYDEYSKSLERQHRYKEAYKYRLLYEEVLKSNNEKKAAAEYDRIAAAFQVDQVKKDLQKSEADILIQEEIVRTKTLFNYILIGVSFIALLGLFFVYQLSKKRKQLNKALQLKNSQFLIEKTKSEKLARAKSDFFSTITHELRTPLYGVIGLSTILLENNKDKDNQEDLKSLKFSADYLLTLVNDVLQINKIESNNAKDEQIDFNPGKLLEKIVSTFEYMRKQNKNVINIHLPSNLPYTISGNATRLSQILMNLIGNANKFTENGVIDITIITKKINDNIATLGFSVKDTGEGIADNKKDHIFEEFKQGDSYSDNYQGTGLGLPIVKRLLNLSNSDIRLNSKLGEGSEFSFDLDFKIIEKVDKNKIESQVPIILDQHHLKGKHILIAEDNRINQIVTKKILEKDGVICTVVENGKEAVKAMNTGSYDLILMDVNMPVMNGLEATKIIKQSYNIPIIALTAIEINEMRQEVIDSGVDDIIIKPYDMEVFKSLIIKKILQKEENNI